MAARLRGANNNKYWKFKNATLQDLENRSSITAIDSLGPGKIRFDRDKLHPQGFTSLRPDGGLARELYFSSATMYGPFEVQDSGDVKVYFFGLHDGEEGHLNCVLYFGEEYINDAEELVEHARGYVDKSYVYDETTAGVWGWKEHEERPKNTNNVDWDKCFIM